MRMRLFSRKQPYVILLTASLVTFLACWLLVEQRLKALETVPEVPMERSEREEAPTNAAMAKHLGNFVSRPLPSGYEGLDEECRLDVDFDAQDSPALVLAVGIISTIRNRDRRDAIRETWMQWPTEYRIKYRFILGYPSSSDEVKALEEEAAQYKDLLILGCPDDYYSLTYKTMGIMTWGAEYCGAYYVMKVDDDVYIQMGTLLPGLLKRYPSNIYAGRFASMYTPRRKEWDKWYISPQQFPFKEGPGYNLGNGYILSRDLALIVSSKRFVKNFRRFRFEDANTGFILSTLPYKRLELSLSTDNTCNEDLIMQSPVPPGGMRFLYESDVLSKTGVFTNFNRTSRCDGYPELFPPDEKARAQHAAINPATVGTPTTP